MSHAGAKECILLGLAHVRKILWEEAEVDHVSLADWNPGKPIVAQRLARDVVNPTMDSVEPKDAWPIIQQMNRGLRLCQKQSHGREKYHPNLWKQARSESAKSGSDVAGGDS